MREQVPFLMKVRFAFSLTLSDLILPMPLSYKKRAIPFEMAPNENYDKVLLTGVHIRSLSCCSFQSFVRNAVGGRIVVTPKAGIGRAKRC